MKIENISDAKNAVNELGEFLKKFEQTLGALGSLTGSGSAIGTTKSGKGQLLAPGVPGSMADRVIAILKGAKEPLTPKEIEKQYLALAWPPPPKGKLYSRILSCAYYLANKKGTLKNDNGSYSIAG